MLRRSKRVRLLLGWPLLLILLSLVLDARPASRDVPAVAGEADGWDSVDEWDCAVLE